MPQPFIIKRKLQSAAGKEIGNEDLSILATTGGAGTVGGLPAEVDFALGLLNTYIVPRWYVTEEARAPVE